MHFVRERSLLEAIASSLTEMFSPNIISERVAGMLANYRSSRSETLAYFDKRLSQAPRDADFALDYVKRHATTPELQQAALDALTLQVRRAVVAARRALFRLCGAGPAAARRLDAGGGACAVTGLAATDVPRLPRGVRLRFDAVRNAHVLLAPERAFDLDDDRGGGARARRRAARRSPRSSTRSPPSSTRTAR